MSYSILEFLFKTQLKHSENDLCFIFIILKPCEVHVQNPVKPQWETSLELP